MYRGGNWNNGSNAGVFYLNGNNSRSNANTNIGFRAALALFVYFLRAKAQQKHQGKRDAFPADKAKDTRSCCSAGGGHRGHRANRAGWPLSAMRTEGRSGSYGVAAIAERSRQGLSHAGHNYDNTRRNEDMDPRNQPSLLERIYSWENLLDAYHEAASEK